MRSDHGGFLLGRHIQKAREYVRKYSSHCHPILFNPWETFSGILQAWCSLQSTHIPSLCGNPELTEAPCDECMMLARRTFKAQFPSLYTPRTLKGLGKDAGYTPPRLAPSYTVGKVN